MVRKLLTRVLAAVIFTAFVAGWAPALGQEEEGVKEEGGVEVERSATGDVIIYEVPLVVEGRLEKPVTLFLKRQQPDFKTVRFDRDFWDDILKPIDKEEFRESVAPKPFDYVKNPLLWMAVATAVSSGAAAGYQAYNDEWPQLRVYGATAGAATAAAVILVLIDRAWARAPR
jgi:hypothetical protein